MITLFLHFLFFNLAKLHRGAKAAPPFVAEGPEDCSGSWIFASSCELV
jgi:hypothetical protein